jgi:transposase-like protein
MIGHGEKLSRKKEQAVLALLSSPSISEAAKAVGISEATLWRWLQRSDFQHAYREARNRLIEQALARLQQATGEAVATLRRNLTSGKASVEVRAAQIILEQATKAIELYDLEERLARLEEVLLGEKRLISKA